MALVDNPRYERANIVVNSKDIQNGGEGSGDFDHAGRPGEGSLFPADSRAEESEEGWRFS